MKTHIGPENRNGQPRMTRMARMKRKFSTQHAEPIRTQPREQSAFVIRVIREIRGFSFGTRIKPENRNWPRENAKNTKKAGLILAVEWRTTWAPMSRTVG